MKDRENRPLTFSSLSEAHRMMGLPQPKHPLISMIDSATAGASFSQPQAHMC